MNRQNSPEGQLVHGMLYNNATWALTLVFSGMVYVPFMACSFVEPLEMPITLAALESVLMILLTVSKCSTVQDEEKSYGIGRIIGLYPVNRSLLRKEIYKACLKTILVVEAMSLLPMLILFLKFNLTVFLSVAIGVAFDMAVLMVPMVEINLRRR